MIRKNPKLTYERAHEVFRYDQETGELIWKVKLPTNHKGNVGDVAGTVRLRKQGPSYRRVRVDGYAYYAHRIVWLMLYGAWPHKEIDHIDGNGLNNRPANLREVSRLINCQNQRRSSLNTSGTVGVSRHKGTGKWIGFIKVQKKAVYLGLFNRLKDARRARKRAEQHYGFHPNHGRG